MQQGAENVLNSRMKAEKSEVSQIDSGQTQAGKSALPVSSTKKSNYRKGRQGDNDSVKVEDLAPAGPMDKGPVTALRKFHGQESGGMRVPEG